MPARRTTRAAADHPPRPAVPLGVWLLAGTPSDQPYPCMCQGTRRCLSRGPGTCPCAGRTDLDNVPRNCCAHGAARVTAPEARAEEARARLAAVIDRKNVETGAAARLGSP